jgi:hypothetical protein
MKPIDICICSECNRINKRMSIGRMSFVALRNDRTTVSDERGYRVHKDDEEEEKDSRWNASLRLHRLSFCHKRRGNEG